METQSAPVAEHRVIRTSLRFVPNVQDIGTDRINGISLLMPDAMIANNIYQITTVPPTQKCTLLVEDVLRGGAQEIKPVISRNCVSFPVQLHHGPVKFRLREGENLLDEHEMEVSPQVFLRSQFGIGSFNERLVSHSLLSGSPVR